MSPIDSIMNAILSFLVPLVTPDWARLVVLIPWLILLLVGLFFALLARAWWRLLKSEPVRGPKRMHRPWRPVIIGHLAVIGLGVLTVILAFVAGSKDPTWDGAQPPVGLLVSFPLLLLGLALAIGAAGNAARIWEHTGDETEQDAIDRLGAMVRRHPRRAHRVVIFIAGVMIAATGLILKPPPDPTTGIQPVATVPVLLLGLVLCIGAAGSAIATLWPSDPDVDVNPENALVVAKH